MAFLGGSSVEVGPVENRPPDDGVKEHDAIPDACRDMPRWNQSALGDAKSLVIVRYAALILNRLNKEAEARDVRDVDS